jgi:hypothetical protein
VSESGSWYKLPRRSPILPLCRTSMSALGWKQPLGQIWRTATKSAMCELEHDAAKGRFEIHRDCSFERPLPRRRLHRSINIAATARKCCVSNSRTCIGPVCPHTYVSASKNAARCTNVRNDEPHCSIQGGRWMFPLGPFGPFARLCKVHYLRIADLGADSSERRLSALRADQHERPKH